MAVGLELQTSVVCFSSVPLPKYHPQPLLRLKLRKRGERVVLSPLGKKLGEQLSAFRFLFPSSDMGLVLGKSVWEERDAEHEVHLRLHLSCVAIC